MRHHKLTPARAGHVHFAPHARPDLERLDDRCLLSGVLPAGSPDPSFSPPTGYVLDPELQSARATVIQSDGSILVGSDSQNPVTGTNFQITRFTSTGQVDRSFGVNGVVVTDFAGGNDQIEQLLVDKAHGTIYAVGEAGDATATVKVGIARYTMNGRLDPTFGMGGKVTTNIVMTGYSQPHDFVKTAVLDTQGELIVGGMATGVKISGDTSSACANYMVRYTIHGDQDASFGTAGKVMGSTVAMTGDYVDECWAAIKVMPTSPSNGTIFTVGINDQRLEVCQFASSGSMVVGHPIGGTMGAVAFAPDGTWFASALPVVSGASSNVQLSAYTVGGVTKFPTATVNLASELHLIQASPVVNAVAIDATGRVVLAGEVTGSRGAPGTIDQALLMRFTPGGQLDTAFGPQGTGVVTADFGPGKDTFTQVVIQSADNKIVAAGQSQQVLTDMVLARYLGEPVTIGGSGAGGGQAGAGLIAQAADPSAGAAVSSLPIDPLAIELWSITPRSKGH